MHLNIAVIKNPTKQNYLDTSVSVSAIDLSRLTPKRKIYRWVSKQLRLSIPANIVAHIDYGSNLRQRQCRRTAAD